MTESKKSKPMPKSWRHAGRRITTGYKRILNWSPKTLRGAVLPAAICIWVFGVGIFEYPFGRPWKIFSIFYALALWLIYFLILYFWMPVYHSQLMLNPEGRFFLIVNVINVAIAVVATLLGLYGTRKFRKCFIRLVLVDETIEQLGMEEDWRRIFVMCLARVLIGIFAIVFLIFCEISWTLFNVSLLDAWILIFILHHPSHVLGAADLHFTTFVRHLHLELCRISRALCSIFGLQLAISMTGHFVILTTLLYSIFTLLISRNIGIRDFVEQAILYISWALYFGTKFFLICRECATVTSEARKASMLIFAISSSVEDSAVKEEVEQFSLQLRQNPLVFTAGGFFTVDFQLVQQVNCKSEKLRGRTERIVIVRCNCNDLSGTSDTNGRSTISFGDGNQKR
ncbi:uncharacterized protein LOC105701428 [Orussus abietinus]|uniref:uncharacterized protein LOC105701428 n=1 Tax=Orussus abietinus TaxID=222816 RepID=UPI000C715E51|nr:uncharacterized protein LOC105701428 [Orussus abietinus]